MTKEDIDKLKPKIDNIIKICQRIKNNKKDSEENGINYTAEDILQNLESEEFKAEKDLQRYLSNLNLEELKIIHSLMSTGKDILDMGSVEVVLDEKNLDKLEDLYTLYYKFGENNKERLAGFITDESNLLDDYLEKGLTNFYERCI